MKYKKPILTALVLVSCLVLFCSMPVFAAELTEAQVEEAVAEQGKEAVTGNVFIWFLCAIAFLKVSQKIDSFMASLGINVGNTGGNMMAELLIAGRGLAGAFHGHGGGGGYRRTSSPGSAAVGGSFLSGGLAGAVGRQVQREAINAATHYSEGPSVGNMLYQSSLKKGGDFANHVISNIAQGNYGQVGSIKGEDAAKAYASYMGIDTSAPDAATYSNMEIGGGRMTGVEKRMPAAGNLPFTVLTNMRRLPMAALRRSNPWTALPGISSTHRIRWRKRRMTLAMEKSPTTNPLSRSSRRHPSERTGCKWRSKAPALGKLSM